jgi:hypothetical protein
MKKEIIALAHRLDKTIQDCNDKLQHRDNVSLYKEEVWSSLEKDLKKNIKKDTALYKKIERTSAILVQNVNDSKISNLVKENIRLLNS